MINLLHQEPRNVATYCQNPLDPVSFQVADSFQKASERLDSHGSDDACCVYVYQDGHGELHKPANDFRLPA